MNINSVFSLNLFGSWKNYATFVPIINTNKNLFIMKTIKNKLQNTEIEVLIIGGIGSAIVLPILFTVIYYGVILGQFTNSISY